MWIRSLCRKFSPVMQKPPFLNLDYVFLVWRHHEDAPQWRQRHRHKCRCTIDRNRRVVFRVWVFITDFRPELTYMASLKFERGQCNPDSDLCQRRASVAWNRQGTHLSTQYTPSGQPLAVFYLVPKDCRRCVQKMDIYPLSSQIRIGISTYRYLYSASGSSGRICPADCESLNSSRTSPSFPSAFRKSSM